MTDFLRSRKGRTVIISAAMVLIAAITVMILLLAGGETGYRNISVSKISGSVTAENNGNSYEAYENMRLAAGYALNTAADSYSRLSLDDDKYVKLEQESRAVFTNVGDARNHITAINLQYGAMTAELVNPLAEEESFVVNTPNAVLAVRGTFFRIVVSFDELGEIFTDVYTYGGAVACRRIMPDGTVVNEDVAVRQGYKARIKMDEIITVYVEELIEYDLGDDVDPIDVDGISDGDIVDMYNASCHGHEMFLGTAALWQEILDRGIDLSEYYSVYDMGEIEEYVLTSEEETEVGTTASESTTAASAATTTTTTTTTTEETPAPTEEASAEATTAASAGRTNSNATVTVPSVTATTTTTAITELTTVTVPSFETDPEEFEPTGTTETVPDADTEPEEAVTGATPAVTETTTVTVPSVTSATAAATTSNTTTSQPAESSSSSSSASVSTEPKPVEGLAINEEHFPDPAFRDYVSRYFDEDGNGYLSDAERAAVTVVTGFYIEHDTIVSLKGIEYFTEMTHLNCEMLPQLEYLDVTKNTELILISCYGTAITSLDVTQNTALTFLDCSRTLITELNVSQNTLLDRLWCQSTGITSLDVTNNHLLELLVCDDTGITSLDVSKNPALWLLECNNTGITFLDLSHNPALRSLGCENCKLPFIDVRNTALESYEPFSLAGNTYPIPSDATYYDISIDPNFNGFKSEYVSDIENAVLDEYGNFRQITGDITYRYNCGKGHYETFALKRIGEPLGVYIGEDNFPDLSFRSYVGRFDIDGNKYLSADEIRAVTHIDVSGFSLRSLEGIEYFTALNSLNCSNNPYLTSLDVSGNTALTNLDCYSTGLTELDVSKNTALEYLCCNNTPMTSLELGNISKLYHLDCSYTEITDLDVSRLGALIKLICENTKLTSIDISRNSALTALWCSNTAITSIDVSRNAALFDLYCNYCNLPYIDISENPLHINLEALGNIYYIPNASTFNATTIPGFDPEKVSEVTNAYYNSATGMFTYISGDVTYTYDCGQGYSKIFTLVRTGDDLGIPVDADFYPDPVFREYVRENFDADKNGYLSEEEISAATRIDFNSNEELTSLKGMEHLTALTYLDCYGTGIGLLDVSSNTALQYLRCALTEITYLVVNSNTELTYLDCSDTEIDSLDVSSNTALQDLRCSGTKITSLDVSNNTALTDLYCVRCSLAYIDVSNHSPSIRLMANDNIHYIPNYGNVFDISSDPAFNGFDPNRVSDLQGAEIDRASGQFYNITSDTITYTYDCGQGYSETFTLVRTSSYSLTALDPLLESQLPPDLSILEGYADPDTDGTAEFTEDRESGGDELDISDSSEAFVTDGGETDPDTDSPADLIEDSGDNLPDSGDGPVEEVLALARGRPP